MTDKIKCNTRKTGAERLNEELIKQQENMREVRELRQIETDQEHKLRSAGKSVWQSVEVRVHVLCVCVFGGVSVRPL